MVVVAPTLPVTTDVPVFEIVPPMSPKEMAVFRLSELPKAGTTAAKAIADQISFRRIFSSRRPEGVHGEKPARFPMNMALTQQRESAKAPAHPQAQ
jgi:hypothetical protein